MALTRWNPFDEVFFMGNEMDPVYEDYLALVLEDCQDYSYSESDCGEEYQEEKVARRVLVGSPV